MPLHVVPVTPHLWGDLAAFFGPSGAYSGCWCTWWRRTAAEFDAGCRDGARGNRAVLQRLTDEGRVPGLLAYDGERPVGWVSVAPRPEFGRLLRSRSIGPGPDEDRADPTVWSVVCFWVPRAQRRSGVGTALLDAAVDHAQARGATVVEGYPVDAEGQVPAAEIFTGTVPMYLRAGFTAVPARKPGGRRVVVRRSV